MTTFGQSLKSVTVQGLDTLVKFRFVLIGIIAVGLGVLFGYLINSPEAGELIISIVVILIVLVLILNKPLNGVLVWVFFTAFIEGWVEIPLGAGIPDLSFSRFLIAFLAIFMLAKAAIGQFRFAQIGLADVCIIATTIGIMVSAPLADRPIDVIQSAIAMRFTPLVIYFFTKNLVRDQDDLHKLLLVIMLFGFVAASYAIYEQTTGNILFLGEGQSADELGTRLTDNLRLIRGLFGRASHFGRVLSCTIPITFYLLFESKNVTRKILLVGMLLVQVCGIFLTYNRTSWYTLLIGLSIIQFFYPQFRKVYFVIVLVAALILWATWDQVNDSTVAEERFDSESTQDFNGRTPRWEAGFNMWKAKPIRGWGFGRYRQESGRFRTDGKRWNFGAIENEYLHILVGSGLIGFFPYLLFLLVPLINSLRLFFRARAPDWSGFIKPEAIAIYWGILLSFAIGSYTQIQTEQIVVMIPAAVAGAVVGSHEHLLHSLKTKPFSSKLLPAVSKKL